MDDDPGMMRMMPGAPEASYLIRVPRGESSCDNMNRMPFNGPYFDDEEMQIVHQWIADGALPRGTR